VRCTLVTVAVALGVVGCGGPIEHDELERAVRTLGATAAEGRLVALDVVEDRTKVTFVRVHCAELADDAEHLAEKLNDAQARPDVAGFKDKAVKLAQDIDSALGDLRVSPTDRALARTVERKLDALAKRADDLAGGL
jgi:hypothetical protein